MGRGINHFLYGLTAGAGVGPFTQDGGLKGYLKVVVPMDRTKMERWWFQWTGLGKIGRGVRSGRRNGKKRKGGGGFVKWTDVPLCTEESVS